MKKLGQIEFGLMATIAAIITIIGASLTISINSNSKSDKAVERISGVEVNISGIRSDIKGINDKLDMLTGYFKLTPKETIIKK